MSDKEKKLTQIGEIGEYGLIEKITAPFQPKNKATIAAKGDDGAVLEFEKTMVTSVRVLNEGIHFNLVYFPLKHLGYKAVVSAISNIIAMNARPTHILTAISLSNRFSVEAVNEIYQGIEAACDRYQLDLAGGDTKSSQAGLSLSITAIGEVAKEDIVYRKGANVNDLICVTGNLGAAYLGLQVLERERAIYEDNQNIQPDLTGNEYILARQLKPEAPIEILDELNQLDIRPTAMIDVTDGLASDVLHLCNQSGKGCRIFQENIPIDKETRQAADELNLEPTTCALNGGDDFELLFTVPIEKHEMITSAANISIIGHIVSQDEGKKLITINNEAVEIIAPGWGQK